MGGLLGSDRSNSATVCSHPKIMRNDSTQTPLLKRPSQLKEKVQLPLGPCCSSAEPGEDSGKQAVHCDIAFLILLHIS